MWTVIALTMSSASLLLSTVTISRTRTRRVVPEPIRDGICEGCQHHYSYHGGIRHCNRLDCHCTRFVGTKPITLLMEG